MFLDVQSTTDFYETEIDLEGDLLLCLSGEIEPAFSEREDGGTLHYGAEAYSMDISVSIFGEKININNLVSGKLRDRVESLYIETFEHENYDY